jgi:histidinol-phosphate aminotransferase
MTRPQPKPGIMDIAPYVPGRAKAEGVAHPLKLSANENPFGYSDQALAAYLEAGRELHLYPDANTSRLRAAIAEKFGLEPERLVFGAGSDELFSMAAQAYLREGDNAVQPQYGFAAWAIAVRAAGAKVKSAPEPDYAPDIDALIAAVDQRTRIVFIANPANPTGAWMPFSDVERLHAAMPANVLLVLDGAYAECASDLAGFSDGLDWACDKQNVLVTRTFSKAYGLAALRIGWGYGPAHVIDALNRIRLPFSVPRAGEAAAVAALEDGAFLQRSLRQFREGRAQIAASLEAMGIRALPSATNFVTAEFVSALEASRVETDLARRGILVRGLANYDMPRCLRISVGVEDDIERVLAALAQISS